MFPVAGLFLIAPARALESDLVKSYGEFNFPVKIIWGSQDNIISGEEMRTLAQKIPNAKLLVYKARHILHIKISLKGFKKTCWNFMLLLTKMIS